MFSNIKRTALSIIHSGISHFWVQPLEDRIIPRLEKNTGWFPTLLLKLASWWANAGRVIVNEMRLLKKRWIGREWSVTYIGNGKNSELICGFLFPNAAEEVESRHIFLWKVPALVRKQVAQGDLVICELNRIIRLSAGSGIDISFTTPQLIQQVIDDFDRPLDQTMMSFQHPTRQRIRKLRMQGYSYEASHSDQEFDWFYHRMYIPYTKERHTGQSMVLCDYDFLKRLFNKGALILIKKDGEPVAGGIRYLEGHTCIAYIMGVLDGRFDLVKQGCNVALGWFGMQWAHQQGARRYNMGSSFPLTANGPFNFKRQWGTRVYPEKGNNEQWSFLGRNLSERMCAHLNRLGLITEIAGKYYQVLLSGPSEPVDEEKLADQLHHASRSGLAGIAVIYPGGESRLISARAAEQEFSEKSTLPLHQFHAP